jgi:DNA-binding CsgD family transcriptional regulator
MNAALTLRERQVAELIEQGLANKEIAGRLNIGVNTAKFHVSKILAKNGVQSRHELPTVARDVEWFRGWWKRLPEPMQEMLQRFAQDWTTPEIAAYSGHHSKCGAQIAVQKIRRLLTASGLRGRGQMMRLLLLAKLYADCGEPPQVKKESKRGRSWGGARQLAVVRRKAG